MTPRVRGILFAQLNALCGGSMMAIGLMVTGKYAPIPLEPQRFVALMYMVVVPVNTVWWLLTHYGIIKKLHADDSGTAPPMSAKGIAWMFGHTLASAIGIIGLWEGISRTTAAVGSLLSRLEVVIAIALGMMFLSERFTKRHWIGFALTLAGMLLVRSGELSGNLPGFLFLLLSALGFGTAEFTGKVAVKYMPVPRLVLIRGWLMMLMLTATWWVRCPGWPSLEPETWLWLLCAAILGPVFARNCYMLSLSYLPVSQVVLLNQAQPLYAALVGFAILGEVPHLWFYVGGAAIILGNIALILAKSSGRDKPSVSPRPGS